MSAGATSAAPVHSARGERLIAVPYGATPISEGCELVISSSGCNLLSPAEARALRSFPRLTFEPEAGGAAVAEIVTSLRHSGLLAGEREILRKLRAAKPEMAGPAIASVGILTCDRPAHLGACAASFIENARDCGRQLEMVVIDDSASAEMRAENIARLQSLLGGAEIRYCGPRQRLAYGMALAKRGIPQSVCKTAIGPFASGHGYGAARNTLMLDQAGQAFLSADDDTLARAAVHPSLKAGLRLAGHCQCFDVFFFRDREVALAWPRWEAMDIIGEHVRLLGGGVELGVDLEMACCHFAEAGWVPRLVGTMPGKVGDSGRGDPYWDQWIGNWTPGRLDLGRFEVAELPASAAIAHGVGCMTTMFALDLRTLLPPFPPRHAGEDRIYADLMDRVVPNACWGIVPHGIVHDRPARRVDEAPPYLNFSQMVGALLAGIPACRTGTPAANATRAVGRELRQFTQMGTTDFRKVTLEFLGRVAAGHLEYSRSICASDAPADQRQAMADARERLLAELARLCGPGGKSPDGFDWEMFRLEVGEFGQLLCAWPAMFEAARALRAKGTRPSMPLADCKEL